MKLIDSKDLKTGDYYLYISKSKGNLNLDLTLIKVVNFHPYNGRLLCEYCSNVLMERILEGRWQVINRAKEFGTRLSTHCFGLQYHDKYFFKLNESEILAHIIAEQI